MLVTLVTAIVAGPVLMLLVLNLIARQTDKVRELTLPVVGIERAPALMAFLERQQVTLTPAPADFEAKIRSGDLDVVLEVDAAFADDVAQGKPATVRLAYDRSRDRARASIAEVEGLLRAFNREWGRGRLMLRGIAPRGRESAQSRIARSRHAAKLRRARAFPHRVLRALRRGDGRHGGGARHDGRRARADVARTPAHDARRRRSSSRPGKWLAVSLLNATAVVLTLAGFYLALRFAPLPAVGIPFLFGLAEFGRFIVALIPLILLMPAILLYVGCRGRTFKEAQSNLSVLLFAVSLLPIVQMFLQKKEPAWLTWIPVSGQYTLLSRALRGEALPSLELLQSYVVPGLLTLAALLAVARLFSRESLLAGK